MQNPLYYQHCPPNVTPDSIRADMAALPPGKHHDDKYYIGFYGNDILTAVMDLILGYPNQDTAYIGFFMINKAIQSKGIGTRVITEVCEYLKSQGFHYVKLGYIKGNPQSEAFWHKNQFEQTGIETQTDHYVIISMLRNLI